MTRWIFSLFRKIDALRWQLLAKSVFFIRRRRWPYGLKVLGPVGLGGGGELTIGRNVKIVSISRYNRAGINHPTELSVQKGAKLVIGDNVGMSGAAIFCMTGITIGNNVLLGANCRIYDTDFHAVDYVSRRLGVNVTAAPVSIGDDVWLAANVTVLKGVNIGERSVIAAGSVVASDVPPNCLAGGVPCKLIRRLSSY